MMKGLAFALLLGGCATARLAATQCGLSADLQAAAVKLQPVEAQALVCASSGDADTVKICEEKVGAAAAALALVNTPAEVNDALRCAAAFIADVATAKATAPKTVAPTAPKGP